MPIEIFTLTFWQVTIARGVSAAASGAVALLVPSGVSAVAPQTHVSIPWWAVVAGGAVSGLVAILMAVAGANINPTATTAAAALAPKRGQLLEVRHVAQPSPEDAGDAA